MNGRSWSDDDIAALRRLVALGWTDGRIAGELGRSRETVQRKRTVLGLKTGQSKMMTKAVWRLEGRRKPRPKSRWAWS